MADFAAMNEVYGPLFEVTAAEAQQPGAAAARASGLAGQRVAHVDELLFLPVPDYATRQAGITTGEYEYIQQIKPDQYDRIKATQGVEPVVVKPYGWVTAVMNTKQGLMTDKRLRQAVQATLDVEPMMLAGLGHKDFAVMFEVLAKMAGVAGTT